MPRHFNKGECVICAIAMFIEQDVERSVYIRLLTSKYFCGGLLLNHILRNYDESMLHKKVILHSEPDAVEFYFKHGFVFTGGVDVDHMGVRYPHMERSTSKKDREIAIKMMGGNRYFWPGLGYYVRKSYRWISDRFFNDNS